MLKRYVKNDQTWAKLLLRRTSSAAIQRYNDIYGHDDENFFEMR
jgi:hypothetical protein